MSNLVLANDQATFDTYPRPFPPAWASAWGDDRFGLWAELELGSGEEVVTQRMRWIAPGRFLMGSPEEELGRDENEGPQHWVTISQGFWLADTACTQELWIVVMGFNPSLFNPENQGSLQHPVECVSWFEVQNFCSKIALPGAIASLPTEAEWEFACRAASTTPFCFGVNISPAQVNYDGRYPYADGAIGEFRYQTVAVRALPANAWGLYQMHGNVSEWCADTQRKYSMEEVKDPGLAQAFVHQRYGRDRVLRGGSFVRSALHGRAVFRDLSQPGGLDGSIGFRFVLRSSSNSPANRR